MESNLTDPVPRKTRYKLNLYEVGYLVGEGEKRGGRGGEMNLTDPVPRKTRYKLDLYEVSFLYFVQYHSLVLSEFQVFFKERLRIKCHCGDCSIARKFTDIEILNSSKF